MKKNLLYPKARVILLCALVFLMAAPAARSETQNPDARLDFSFRNAQLKRILQEVEKQSDYYFVYNHDQINADRRITIRVENETVQRVLQMLFEGTDVRYEIKGRQIALSPAHFKDGETAEDGSRTSAPVVARDGTPQNTAPRPGMKVVTGRVQDSKGQPLVGASVYASDLSSGTAADADGRFTLQVPEGTRTLTVSMIGYQKREASIPASGPMTVILEDDLQQMSEIIVTGYQTLSPERATGSFGRLSGEELDKRLDPDVMSKLEGAIPGLYYHDGSYRIRGVSSLYAESSPLYVVDGYQVSDLSGVNPRDIANVTVLKDAAAASIYGVRGANGVIVVTTNSGRGGKIRIHANSSLSISPIPDYSKMNLMNSSELVDFQQSLFELGSAYYSPGQNGKLTAPAAVEALYYNKTGEVSDEQLQQTLDRLRASNNSDQVKDNLMQTGLTQNHALSASGGTDTNRYYISMNYEGTRGLGKGAKSNKVTVLFKESVDLARWVTVEGAVTARLTDGRSDGNNYSSYFGYNAMPYDMLIDQDGELTRMYRFKSQREVDRLVELGLYDEASNPITERKKVDGRNDALYLRLQGGVTFKPLEGLDVSVSYQTERSRSRSKTFSYPDSYSVKRNQNDATQIVDGEIVRNIPYGGTLAESRANMRNYTFRVQANFNRRFGALHYVSALAGAERRSEVNSSTRFYKLAYDDSRNLYSMIDVKALAEGLKGTEGVYGTFSYNDIEQNYIREKENRYVSFFANAGYTYDDRYNVTLSARMDDTNLFGSDPKYRYLPMWSAGVKWNITNERFMAPSRWLDMLALRVTYGITGNVDHGSGPFLVASTFFSTETGAMGTEIESPPNRSLRWEKTAVFNVGVDMSVLNHRINATVEFYNRNTTDLLATTAGDPTNKFSSVTRNFGNLYNRGVELGLNTLTCQAGDFRWNTTLNFSYNFNKIVKGNEGSRTVLAYTNAGGVLVEGRPRDALFSFRYAGLNPDYGTIRVYDKDGEIVENFDDQHNPKGMLGSDDIESLVYSGTTRPKWTLGFINTFTWRSLSLTVHIVANGGHVIQDPLSGLLNAGSIERNHDKRMMNFWREPGDENKKGVIPAPVFKGGDSQYNAMWYAADRHIMPGDYLKVRNIMLNYEMPHRWFGRTIFSEARLTFQVKNLCYWARNRENIDPESLNPSPSNLPTRSTPTTPTYMIGLDFTF